MAADILDGCKEVRKEAGSCADQGYIYWKLLRMECTWGSRGEGRKISGIDIVPCEQ